MQINVYQKSTKLKSIIDMPQMYTITYYYRIFKIFLLLIKYTHISVYQCLIIEVEVIFARMILENFIFLWNTLNIIILKLLW